MEHSLLFLIIIFQVFLLFFLHWESTWTENVGQFLYHHDPDTRKMTKRLEKYVFPRLYKTCLNNN